MKNKIDIIRPEKTFFIYGYELTEEQKKEFDYYSAEELDQATFFKYRDSIYDLGEFMRLDRPGIFPKFWQGYRGDSYFNGILVNIDHSGEQITAATYIS